ncbi:MAG: S8 family peptidase [Saprospiraceae bacterium]
MKQQLLLLAICMLFAATAAHAQDPSAAAAPRKLEPIPGQYIVVMKESAAAPVIKQTGKSKSTDRDKKELENNTLRTGSLKKLKDLRAKAKVQESAVLMEYADVVVGFSAKLNDNDVKNLRADQSVEGVYQDYLISLGPITPEANAKDLNAAAQTTTCAITTAGGSVNGSTKATWIWILDTGIDMDHPDLNVQTNTTYAKSFVPGQTVEDGHGHGTHCAGIAAAKNNGFGVIGVSAGAKVVPVKVLSNSGTGSFSYLYSALNHVAKYDIPGDVVSMSLGAFPVSNCETTFQPAISACIKNLGAAGTWVCIAAGNDYNSGGNASRRAYPACVNGTRVFTVSSINCNKTCASYSNWGNPSVDWVAVGTSVYSTYKNGGYGTLSGTSMATPVVAGICHAKNAAPVSAGNVTCAGTAYKIAKR